MEISFYLISGLMFGLEYVPYEEDGFSNGFVVDLFVVRIMFLW
jgi:hypothetical protein